VTVGSAVVAGATRPTIVAGATGSTVVAGAAVVARTARPA
jgi:hypothetical protein